MSRSTQWMGFTPESHKWLLNNAICEKVSVITTKLYRDDRREINETINDEINSIETGQEVTGMFEELVHKIREYPLKNGKVVEEYIQAEPWSSGPCIFMALRYKDTKKPIRASLWSQKEIDNC